MVGAGEGQESEPEPNLPVCASHVLLFCLEPPRMDILIS